MGAAGTNLVLLDGRGEVALAISSSAAACARRVGDVSAHRISCVDPSPREYTTLRSYFDNRRRASDRRRQPETTSRPNAVRERDWGSRSPASSGVGFYVESESNGIKSSPLGDVAL